MGRQTFLLTFLQIIDPVFFLGGGDNFHCIILHSLLQKLEVEPGMFSSWRIPSK